MRQIHQKEGDIIAEDGNRKLSIIRHGKYFWLDIRIKGKRIRRSLHTASKFEALDRYKEKKDELLAEYDAGDKILFSDFCTRYIEWAFTSKPKVAIKEEQRLKIIRRFIEDKLEIKHLEDITPFHIEQFKSKLKNDGLKKSTINGWLQVLRGLFYRAIDWEVYSKPNPLKKVRFFKAESATQGLSKGEISRVLDAAKAISDKPYSPIQVCFYDIVVLALNTGLRRSELLNLKWRDIKEGSLEIKGKGDKIRIVPLNKIANDVIMKQARRGEFIFDVPNRNNATVLHRTTERVSKMAGVDFHLHLCRHAFCTSLVERGVDFVTVGAILGHSTVTMSLIYAHTDEERKKKAVDLLGVK